MEFYDRSFTQQLAPLVAVALDPSHQLQLFGNCLNRASITGKIWDTVIVKNQISQAKYCFRFFDDEKAILSAIASYLDKTSASSDRSWLSPFNPQSDLFPNGILSLKWFGKYTQQIPAAVLCSYRLPVDATQDEALGILLTTQRETYAAFNVKLIAVVVSDTDDNVTAHRIAQLRLISGLPQSLGLFHICTGPTSTNATSANPVFERDCEILSAKIISMLKSICTDFYSAIEHRVEQRNNKYYSLSDVDLVDTKIRLTPAFLEVRHSTKRAMLAQLMHPHNIEGALPLIENAYAGLIALVSTYLPVFISPQVSVHDRALKDLWVTLLDVLALHLVRGYFSIEEPVAALRKHDAHIKNVRGLLSGLLGRIWIALQYHWLADLMCQIPRSILSDLYVSGGHSENLSVYFGGIAFHDDFSSSVVTVPSLLYVKAARSVKCVNPQDNMHFSNRNDIIKYRVGLLQTSRVLVKESEESFVGFESYLSWQIAEDLLHIGDLAGAEELFNNILNQKSVPRYLYSQILAKRLTIFEKTGNSDKLLQTAVEYAVVEKEADVSRYLDGFSGLYIVSLELRPVFEIEPLMYAENSEVYALSEVTNQFKITSKPWLTAPMIGGLKLEQFEVSQFKVIYENGLEVILIGSGTQNEQVQSLKFDDLQFDSSMLKNGFVVVKYGQIPKISGWLGISRVEVELSLTLSTETAQFQCSHIESSDFSKMGLQNSVDAYFDEDGKTQTNPKLLKGRAANRIFIKPYRPEIVVECKPKFQRPILEEKLVFPVSFSRSSLPCSDIKFKELVVEVKSRVYESGEETSAFYVQSNWHLLKDDVPLDMLDFVYSQEMTTRRQLQASVRRVGDLRMTVQTILSVVFEFRLIICEQSNHVSSYELTRIEQDILVRPFSVCVEIALQVSTERNLIPNPFVLRLDNDDYSMPQPIRLWNVSMGLVDGYEVLEKREIEIKSANFNLKSKSTDILVELEGDIKLENECFHQVFSSRSKTHLTHSSVQISVQGIVEWKREGEDSTYSLAFEEKEFTISVQEPRVTLVATQYEKNAMQLKYTLENPTARILTFATNLLTDRAALHGTEWRFDDVKNLAPLKQPAFPILPFSMHHVVFYGQYTSQGLQNLVELPRLRVQDMNYKVELPTVTLQENIREIELSLIYEVV